MKPVRNTFAMVVITAMLISAASASSAAESTGQVININTASQAELETLPGIGPSKAKAIVDYRTKHPFAKPEDIMRVKGIGKKSFLKLKPYLAVSGTTQPVPKTPQAQQ